MCNANVQFDAKISIRKLLTLKVFENSPQGRHYLGKIFNDTCISQYNNNSCKPHSSHPCVFNSNSKVVRVSKHDLLRGVDGMRPYNKHTRILHHFLPVVNFFIDYHFPPSTNFDIAKGNVSPKLVFVPVKEN